jgi:hypothetical protein
MAKTSACKKAMESKESDLERSARLSLRSLELRQQACFKRVVAIFEGGSYVLCRGGEEYDRGR